ncbi:pentapeptide repeat-containing protein [Nostoc ellipsosporum NOK]|nr:pentapeptide repeat-containing protein [Nostoc ellipsosporum NOK]
MALPTEKFEVRNRWTNAIQFTAEITCAPDATIGVKLGLAIRWAARRGNGADLSGADLRGADLSDADLSDADLRGADLRGADLRGADLRGAVLRGAVLSDADLSDADLRGAVLRGAVLRGAVLSDADLRGAVLRGAPKIENIHQKVYAAASQPGALDMGDWHVCETTHCRAGWVTFLAGDEGKALEQRMGTAAAASLIYLASDPSLDKFPDFYCSNGAALEDMKRLADLEAGRVSEAD